MGLDNLFDKNLAQDGEDMWGSSNDPAWSISRVVWVMGTR